MRALVLGASGFIGRWIARLLAVDGIETIAAARDPTATVRFDASDPLDLARLLEETQPTHVFNAVGYGVDRSEQDQALARTINAELPVAIAKLLAPDQMLIHVGSALEYGAIGGDLCESSLARPTTWYGSTKLEGTERLHDFAVQAGLRTVTARLFTVYGPGEHPGRLLPTLLSAASSVQPLDFTTGTQERDFTYVEDAARALIMLAQSDRVGPGEVVNVATGRLTSVRVFIETAMRVLDLPPERIRFGALPTRAEEMAHDPVSVAHLAQLIAWIPTTRAEEGIRRTVAWQPPAW